MDRILKYFPRISDRQKEQFEALYGLYSDWNSKINVISRKDIENLFAMTPYFYRTSSNDKAKLRDFSSLYTKIDVELFIYKKK